MSTVFLVQQELLKVLYVDQELTYLKDLDLAAAGSTEKSDASYDGRNGVRSIRVSPDGRHLASGDRYKSNEKKKKKNDITV